jgi:hypothetical protein
MSHPRKARSEPYTSTCLSVCVGHKEKPTILQDQSHLRQQCWRHVCSRYQSQCNLTERQINTMSSPGSYMSIDSISVASIFLTSATRQSPAHTSIPQKRYSHVSPNSHGHPSHFLHHSQSHPRQPSRIWNLSSKLRSHRCRMLHLVWRHLRHSTCRWSLASAFEVQHCLWHLPSYVCINLDVSCERSYRDGEA